ncbi:MAG: hypothetical protein WA049_13150 [Ferribacterium limneticum]
MIAAMLLPTLAIFGCFCLALVCIRHFNPRSKGLPLAAGGKPFAFQVSESRFVDFDGSVFDFDTGQFSAFEPRSKGSPLAAGGRP